VRWGGAIGVLALTLACAGAPARAAAPANPAAPCQTAQALQQAGLDQQARAAYARVLAADPSAPCATEGLAQLDEQSAAEQVHGTVADIGEFAAAVGLGLLLFALLLWVVVVVFTHVWPLYLLPGVRRLRRVRLQLRPLDDGATRQLGPGTTGLLRARLVHDANDARIALATGPSDTGALDGLADVSDQARVVVALLRLLRAGLPKRDWVVTGVLQGRCDDGEGLTLSLDDGRRYSAFGEFWSRVHDGGARTTDEAEIYRRLTIPAAGWLGFHVAQENDPRALLATDADSWALFTVGLHLQDRAETPAERSHASDFYERAIGADRSNIAAHANLGVMLAEDGRLDAAEQHLRTALRLLEGR